MIVGSHAGEDLLPSLLAGGAGAGSLLVAVWRARLGRFLDRLRGR